MRSQRATCLSAVFPQTCATGTPARMRAAWAADKAKLKNVGLHTLRHSAATAMLENGVNLKAVSEALRHSSIAITGDVYAHISENTLRSAMATLAIAIGL